MTDTYTLDVLKWRCGGEKENSLGTGSTMMLNSDGFMCCLDQFGSKKVETDTLAQRSTPAGVADGCQVLYDKNFVKVKPGFGLEYENTTLACELMTINDSSKTTPKQKVEKIRSKLKEHGLKLRVRNAMFLW